MHTHTNMCLCIHTYICVYESESEVSKSCPTLCNPMDCSLPGFSVHEVFRARILEWLPFPSPGNLPDPGIQLRSLTLQADSLPSEPPGNPICVYTYTYKYACLLFIDQSISLETQANLMLSWSRILFSRKLSFCLKTFNWLDEDHSHFQGNFLTTSPKYLQSNT